MIAVLVSNRISQTKHRKYINSWGIILKICCNFLYRGIVFDSNEPRLKLANGAI
jgi:hypothetical protein